MHEFKRQGDVGGERAVCPNLTIGADVAASPPRGAGDGYVGYRVNRVGDGRAPFAADPSAEMQGVSWGQRETGFDVNQFCVGRVTRSREVVAAGKQRVERVQPIVGWILVPRSRIELQTDSWRKRDGLESPSDDGPRPPRRDTSAAHTTVLRP